MMIPDNRAAKTRCSELAEILEQFLASNLPHEMKVEKIQVAEQKVIRAMSSAIAARTGEHVRQWM